MPARPRCGGHGVGSIESGTVIVEFTPPEAKRVGSGRAAIPVGGAVLLAWRDTPGRRARSISTAPVGTRRRSVGNPVAGPRERGMRHAKPSTNAGRTGARAPREWPKKKAGRHDPEGCADRPCQRGRANLMSSRRGAPVGLLSHNRPAADTQYTSRAIATPPVGTPGSARASPGGPERPARARASGAACGATFCRIPRQVEPGRSPPFPAATDRANSGGRDRRAPLQ